MNEEYKANRELDLLRQKADEVLKTSTPTDFKLKTNLSEVETIKLIHELQVHQVELEMQNDELRHAWAVGQIAVDKFTELYDFAPTGYLSISKEGRIVELNIHASKILGKERQRVRNSLFSFFVSEDTKPVFRSFFEKICISKTKESCELKLMPNDSSPLYVKLSGRLNEHEDQVMISIIDITEQTITDQLLKFKTDALEKLNAEKDKFFSIIAHDLRSPFNGFLGLTEILSEELDSLDSAQIQKIAVSIRKSATSLFALLENLLEWSRIQRGIISFEPVIAPVMTTIEEVVETLRASAEKKEIAIVFEIPGDCTVLADKYMLTSIIRNLFTNAIKFTPRGGTVTIKALPAAGNSVEILIRDNGIGMNKNMVENLFRLDEQTTRKGTEGEPTTGLGLIICKEFVEKHGGKILIESEEGIGSTFCFSLPATV